MNLIPFHLSKLQCKGYSQYCDLKLTQDSCFDIFKTKFFKHLEVTLGIEPYNIIPAGLWMMLKDYGPTFFKLPILIAAIETDNMLWISWPLTFIQGHKIMRKSQLIDLLITDLSTSQYNCVSLLECVSIMSLVHISFYSSFFKGDSFCF